MSGNHTKAGRRASFKRACEWYGDPTLAWQAWYAAMGAPEATAACQDAPRALRGEGVSLAITSWGWPLEIAGTVDDYYAKFYASRGQWMLRIGNYVAEGDDEDDWLAWSRAWAIVREHVPLWRQYQHDLATHRATAP